MLYVQENEITNKLKIVTVLKEGQEIPPTFLSDLEVLDRAYDELDVDFVSIGRHIWPGINSAFM